MAVNQNEPNDAKQIADGARAHLRKQFEQDGPEEEFEIEVVGGLLTPPEPGKEMFDGDVKTLRVTKDVYPVQLVDEIDDRLGDADRFQVAVHLDDDEAPVSEKNPLTLYIHGDPDMRTVRGAVESHVPNPHHGMTAGEIRVAELKDKLRSGKDLPASELSELLRATMI